MTNALLVYFGGLVTLQSHHTATTICQSALELYSELQFVTAVAPGLNECV